MSKVNKKTHRIKLKNRELPLIFTRKKNQEIQK